MAEQPVQVFWYFTLKSDPKPRWDPSDFLTLFIEGASHNSQGKKGVALVESFLSLFFVKEV
jgi:hypothetical protein